MSDPLISVSATGSVRIRPDLARVRLSCSTEDEGGRAAFEACASVTAAVIAALRDAGIGDGDVSTSGVQLSRRRDNGRYVAQNNLVVTVRPPDRTGEVLGVAVDAGGDALSIDQLVFDLADASEALSEARARAVHSARERAEELAAAASVQIGQLVSLSEGGGRPPIRMGAMRAAATPSPPVEVGEQEVAVTVSAEFEILGGSAT